MTNKFWVIDEEEPMASCSYDNEKDLLNYLNGGGFEHSTIEEAVTIVFGKKVDIISTTAVKLGGY